MSTSFGPSRDSTDTVAPSGRHHRDRQRAVQVVALPLEDRVRPLHHLEEQVPGGAAARAGLALARQLDARAVLDVAGMRTFIVRLVRTRPSPSHSGQGRGSTVP